MKSFKKKKKKKPTLINVHFLPQPSNNNHDMKVSEYIGFHVF